MSTWSELVADALCAEVDPEMFFPDEGRSNKAARKICGKCEIEEQCREWAVAHPRLDGIWGGTTERERQKIRMRKTAA